MALLRRPKQGGMSMTKKYNTNKRRNNKKPLGIPKGTDRLDDTLMSEIRLFISLGNTVEQASRAFKVSEQMVKYSCKKGKDFNSLQSEMSNKED